MSVMPETVASRVATNNAEALVEAGSTQLIRVEPNDSRVDCSNYNPLDVWNMGVQMAALHFQVKTVIRQNLKTNHLLIFRSARHL